MSRPKTRKRGPDLPRPRPRARPRATAGKAGKAVFISYSRQDASWKRRLVIQLQALQLRNLDPWDDGRIKPGIEWLSEILSAIENARVAILLVSADFLASKFIGRKEVPRLLERRKSEGLKVLPLIVRPCPWKRIKWLSKMEVWPKDGKALSEGGKAWADARLTEVAGEVYDLVKAKKRARGKGRPKAPSGEKVPQQDADSLTR